MGNLLACMFKPKKKMQIPRSLDELCDTINWKETSEHTWPGLEGVALRSSWVRAFLDSGEMKGDPQRRDLLLFYLACTGLEKGVEVEACILQDVQTLFFSDSEFLQPSIHFADINNTVDEVFRLFDSEVKDEETRSTLKRKLISLKQDESVRSGLNPVFSKFIKTRSAYGPAIQQCILAFL